MPRPRHSPPACLQGRVFTTAEAEAAGVAKRHLSGRQYCSWGKGLWSCADSRPDPRTRSGLLRILPALQQEGWAASHTTAAMLHDFRLPGRLGHVGGIHLCSSTGSRPRGRGVVGHRSQFHAEDLWTDGSVRLTSPARTLLDLAASTDARGRHVMTHQQLVAVIDGVICEHRTGISRGVPALRSQRDLSTDLERFESHRGVRRVRQALLRAVVGVDSPLETYTRLVLEDHRFTGWEADVEIRSPGGRRVHPDLADRRHRLAVQVDGAVHEDPRQRLRDVERQRATEAAGWTELRVVHTDLDVVDPTDPGCEPRIVTLVRAHRQAVRARELAGP